MKIYFVNNGRAWFILCLYGYGFYKFKIYNKLAKIKKSIILS